VAGVALGDFPPPHVVLAHEPLPVGELIFRGSPDRIEHVLPRPEVLFRVAVAVQAPRHVEAFRLPHQGHGADRSVVLGAARARPDVHGMVEVDESGRSLIRVQRSGWPVRQLSRTGASMAALVQTWEWQLMQVSVGGRPAKAARSTEVWQ